MAGKCTDLLQSGVLFLFVLAAAGFTYSLVVSIQFHVRLSTSQLKMQSIVGVSLSENRQS